MNRSGTAVAALYAYFHWSGKTCLSSMMIWIFRREDSARAPERMKRRTQRDKLFYYHPFSRDLVSRLGIGRPDSFEESIWRRNRLCSFPFSLQSEKIVLEWGGFEGSRCHRSIFNVGSGRSHEQHNAPKHERVGIF